MLSIIVFLLELFIVEKEFMKASRKLENVFCCLCVV
jgi:hypothetical protein